MTEPSILPPLMIAPNGARLTDDDHAAIPVTIPQIVAVAKDCAAAGAGAMHFHVRDAAKAHILDAGLYREALAELMLVVPEMHHQITTETVGRYGPEDMRAVTRAVVPPGVSIGVPEMILPAPPRPRTRPLWLAGHRRHSHTAYLLSAREPSPSGRVARYRACRNRASGACL